MNEHPDLVDTALLNPDATMGREPFCCLPECLDGCVCLTEADWEEYEATLELARVQRATDEALADHARGDAAFADRDRAMGHLVAVVAQSVRRSAIAREAARAERAATRARDPRSGTGRDRSIRGRARRAASQAAPVPSTASAPNAENAEPCACHPDPVTGAFAAAADDVYPLAPGLASIEAIARLRVYLDSLELEAMAGLHASASGMLEGLAKAGRAEAVPVTAEQVVVEEIRAATGGSRVRETVALAASGPRGAWLRDRVRSGVLSSDRAALAYSKTRDLSQEAAESLWLDLFGDLTGPGTGQAGTSWGAFDRALRSGVDAAEPEAAQARLERARAQRGVFLREDGSCGQGNASLTVVNDATKIRAAWAQADALARMQKACGDPRTLDQLRADIMCHFVQPPSDLAADAPNEDGEAQRTSPTVNPAAADVDAHVDSSEQPARSERRANTGQPAGADQHATSDYQATSDEQATSGSGAVMAMAVPRSDTVAPGRVTVVIPWSTLLGLDDNPCLTPENNEWVSAQQARAMFSHPDSIFRALYVDPPTGAAIKLTSKAYSPPRRLREHVQSIDGTCRFVACDVPAHRCDQDHVNPYRVSGRTSNRELSSLHRAHHNLKTAGLWACAMDPATHEVTWTSPSGRTYVTQAKDWLAQSRRGPARDTDERGPTAQAARLESQSGAGNPPREPDEPPPF